LNGGGASPHSTPGARASTPARECDEKAWKRSTIASAVASGPTAEFAATGVGTDVRVSAADVAAAALVADGRTVHLGAFAN